MSITLLCDLANRVLFTSFEQSLTEESFLEARAAVAAAISAQPFCALIIDFSHVADVEISTESIRSIASGNRVTDLPRVVVAPQPVVYGYVRMVQLIRDTSDPALKVVRTLEEAYQMLGLRSPHFVPLDDQAAAADASS